MITMTKTTNASALIMTMLLSTALLGACNKTETAATPPAGTSSTTTTTTTTPPAATGTTDSATTGAAATATPPATTSTTDSTAAAADSAAAAANNAAAAATTAASNAADKAGDALGDSALTGKVKAMLLADSEVKGTDINVETSKGEVMLSGFVESQAQIDKAAKLASGVDGVKSVSNKLEIKK
jgi:hyperosmotically inducible protein